ncbi:MAG: FAD:protein FMN transferase [Caldisericaceae bacterium]
MNKKVLVFPIVVIVALLIFFLIFYYVNFQNLHREIYSMDTIIEIDIFGANREKIADEIEKEINYLASLFDDYNPNSEVSKINANAGVKPVKVSDDTLEIINKGKEMFEKTNGAFNIMISPVLRIWGFKDENYRVPTLSEIKQSLTLTDINDLVIDSDEVFLKKKGEAIDLGGIAKGYTLDKIKAIIEKNKPIKAIVNMGGNVYVYSIDPNKIFKVGIKHPRSNGVIAVLELKSGNFVATSGDYERYFELNGERYCHIIDPRSGSPAKKLVSATAITKDGYVGDAFSTALFVLGKDDALKLASESNIQAVVVDTSLNVFYSESLSGSIEFENR